MGDVQRKHKERRREPPSTGPIIFKYLNMRQIELNRLRNNVESVLHINIVGKVFLLRVQFASRMTRLS